MFNGIAVFLFSKTSLVYISRLQFPECSVSNQCHQMSESRKS